MVSENTLPAATQDLVELRAGQINGCGFSTDMHTKDSRTPAGPRRGSTWSRPARGVPRGRRVRRATGRKRSPPTMSRRTTLTSGCHAFA
ncbi:MAG TPA: carboxymuconolactone decarboxylase family protein [Nocardioides sp.]